MPSKKYLIPSGKVQCRGGQVVEVPAIGFAIMYHLDARECVVYGSPMFNRMTVAEREKLHVLPRACVGLYSRWLNILEEYKSGGDSAEVTHLRRLLADAEG